MRCSSVGLFGLALLCASPAPAAAFNIVAVATLGTASHFIWTNTLISRLVERGHRVTEVTVRDTAPHPNRTTFVMDEAMYTPDAINKLIHSKNTGTGGSFVHEIKQFYKQMVVEAKEKLNSTAFQRLKSHLATSDEKIDLILIDHSNRDALISISHLVDYPPVVAMTPFNHPATFNTIMGNLQSPSLAPHDLTPYTCEMSLHERISNVLGYAFARFVESFYFEPKVDGYLRDHFGPGAPTLADLESRIAVALVNTHPTTHCQRPVLPSVVDVGFLHVAPPKSLPKDVEEFLDGATEGAIIISFGSVVRLDLMPKFQREIIAIFGKMKQRFLWKTANPPKNLPENVRAYRWLPQSDVLAHRNVRVLVAHGGTLSMQEALYHGVPLVLLPFYLDQHGNALRVHSLGAGRLILTHDLSAENLHTQINTVLHDPSYKTTMSRLSRIARDQPERPLERAVFWVEFVARHRGAPHFRHSHRHMSWIQLYSIDVTAVLILGLTLTTAIFVTFLRKVSRKG